MGRPKKSEMGPVPTAERLLRKALELFARRGFDAVSVRDITRPLGLNEATLYIHYRNKSALLDAIFDRLKQNLIDPGFRVPPPETFGGEGGGDPVTYLVEGAKHFFSRADRETLLTWRLLMINQYGHQAARHSLEEQLLNAPVRFVTSLLENMQAAGKIRRDVDCRSAGRIIAALFFDYSFRSNLKAAWDEDADGEFARLSEDLAAFTESLVDNSRRSKTH